MSDHMEDAVSALHGASERKVLTFSRLRRVNVERCESPTGFNHPLESWSVAEWTNAMAGEAGEAANVAKKMIRFRDGVRGNQNTLGELRVKLAQELADVLIYLDLVAASQGIDLEAAVIDTFNRKSLEIGAKELL